MGEQIFVSNRQDPDLLDNQEAVRQYVGFYGMNKYDNKGKWGERVGENFAEDFCNLFGGFEKNPRVWKGQHKQEIREFINTWLPKADLSQFYLKGYGIQTSEGRFWRFNNPYISFKKAETFVTKDKSIEVFVEGLDIDSKNIEVLAVPVGVESEEDIFASPRGNGRFGLEFPQKGVYEVQIWIDKNYITPGFNFYVVCR